VLGDDVRVLASAEGEASGGREGEVERERVLPASASFSLDSLGFDTGGAGLAAVGLGEGERGAQVVPELGPRSERSNRGGWCVASRLGHVFVKEEERREKRG
jgi:hypothetical protein